MGSPVDELRGELRAADLDERFVAADPIDQFRAWYRDAEAARVDQPEAMVLATAGADGRPAARVVLLRGFDERGFAFYTNLESAKGRDLAENPRAALVFHWREIGRQVRVTGAVVAVPRDDAARYYAARPRGSRIGAWASPQSTVLAGRAELERRLAEAETRFAGSEPPLPPFWGGFRVVVGQLELWQEREARLHDRVRYRRAEDGPVDGPWIVERLAP
ncbi:MAG TPA: pyridoxamine 5'-phosphate oxidase [Acidimicrobiia bacterium]